MAKMVLIAPCHFGLEAVLKREITELGYEIESVDDGRVSFYGDGEAVAMANLALRTAERILIRVGIFKATSFDQLFERTKALPWNEILPRDARFWVTKVSSVKSQLFSPSDIQSVMKKAMVEQMKIWYGISRFPETGASYPLRVSIKKDIVTVGLDTTGTSLHKRGYRVAPVIAPISETLAAAILGLTPWHPDRILVDPFCGSGTIPIEAAMQARHIAPGLRRHFLAEEWKTMVDEAAWFDARQELKSQIISHVETDIQGYDIDPRAVRFARQNAEAAGVGDIIHFQARAVRDLHHPKSYGFIVTNPPYGERIEDKAALPELYGQIGDAFRGLPTWSMYLITSYEDAEKYIGRRADKNRKLYNGMLKTYVYQYLGPKPPKRTREERV